MGKGIEELTTTKYLIHAQINANGIVEKPDVVGAVFGQTEGLLNNDLDIRELQKTGRIGRIKVIIHSNKGRAKGEVVIPSSLDRIETAILAASLETINRIGPCEAYVKIIKVEDVRAVKREQVVNRAKEIYKSMMEKANPESMKMIEEVKESMRIHEISEYGDEKLPAGPTIHTSDRIIVVEGRSDVLNLLKHGIKNTVAIEGVNIPHSIINLTKNKIVTVFVDGDRGGELILKEFMQVCDIDYVTRAPKDKEVEELEEKEVMIALRDKVPVEQYFTNIKPKAQPPKIKDKITLMKNILRDLEGTNNAEILDDALNILNEVKVEKLYNELQNINKNVYAVILDGIINQKLVDISASKRIKNLVAFKAKEIVKRPEKLKIITY